MTNEQKTLNKIFVYLIISGCCNIILLFALLFVVFKETPPQPFLMPKPQEMVVTSDKSNGEWIKIYKNLSTNELYSLLSNSEKVDEGYTKRDLALATLVNFHYFDLKRAVQKKVQKRRALTPLLRNGKPLEVVLFTGLDDQDFLTIQNFIKTEKWPITTRGLFKQLKKNEDSSLEDAFYLTPEFSAIEALVSRSKIPLSKKEILNILLEGTYSTIESFYDQQKIVQDLSSSNRQKFLLKYIEQKSSAAALSLLKTDPSFAVKKLDDHHIILLLELLNEKNPLIERFALALLASPRSDEVWKAAANRLYALSSEKPPEKFDHQQILAHFFPKPILMNKPLMEVPLEKAKPPAPSTPTFIPRDKLYVVQEGDSLWKISRRFKLSVETIIDHNQLKSDFLKPGTVLKIPF